MYAPYINNVYIEGSILQVMATLLKMLPMYLIKHLYILLLLCKPVSRLCVSIISMIKNRKQ